MSALRTVWQPKQLCSQIQKHNPDSITVQLPRAPHAKTNAATSEPC